ncbi:MAG TPA: FMN-binding protein [Methylophilaceae bacterium]|nr:FMN-binding protein [Methylophilaceae bacterium]
MAIWRKVCGIAVLATALATAVPAQATVYRTLEQVEQAGFPEADKFTAVPIHLTEDQAKAIREASGVRVLEPNPKVWKASKGGKDLGWLIVDQVYGKHEFITYATSLSNEGSVRLVEVMDYRETHGGEVRNPAWLQQFIGKVFGDPVALDNDIQNISGATLSCKHMADGVKRLLAMHHLVLSKQ